MPKPSKNTPKPAAKSAGEQAIKAVFDALPGTAERASRLRDFAGKLPIPGGYYKEIAPGQWLAEADEYGLPPDCPIIPLGVEDDNYWFLDTLGQLRKRPYEKFSIAATGSLFHGLENYLYWAWPKFKDKEVVSWRAEKVAEKLRRACAFKGSWSLVDRARGRGAWLLEDGRLVVHCGTSLFVDGKEDKLGELEGNVYMTRPPVMRPWPEQLVGQSGPATTLLPLLKTWNWGRPDVDPYLFLGWLGAAMVSGALAWRPACFITGDRATGKSTLHDMVQYLFGGALIQSADTTAAGIYQQLKSDALPVAIDEIEGRADNRRTKAIIELMRAAASGALILRGGDNHQGQSFYARSCFLFSAINTPPLEPQDASRMAMLRLQRLNKDQPAPKIIEKEFNALGQQILRRMMDNWHRFEANLEAYREVLAAGGHDSRGQDTFGVLLACADLVIDCDGDALGVNMGTGADDLSSWSELLQVDKMSELEDAGENWRLCLDHVISVRVEAWRQNTRQTVGQVLEAFNSSGEGKLSFSEVNVNLEQAGLKLIAPKQYGIGNQAEYRLYVPNQHPLLNALFTDTKWTGGLGTGVWSNALQQAPLKHYERCQARVAGHKGRGISFLLDVVMEWGD